MTKKVLRTDAEKKFFYEHEDKENNRITIDYYRYTCGNVAAHYIPFYLPEDVIDKTNLSDEEKKEFKQLQSKMLTYIICFIGSTYNLVRSEDKVIPSKKEKENDLTVITKIQDKIDKIIKRMSQIAQKADDISYEIDMKELDE